MNKCPSVDLDAGGPDPLSIAPYQPAEPAIPEPDRGASSAKVGIVWNRDQTHGRAPSLAARKATK